MRFSVVCLFFLSLLGSANANEASKGLWQAPYAKPQMVSRHLPDRCAIYGNGEAYFHCALVLSATSKRPEPEISGMSFVKMRTKRVRKKPQALALLKVAAKSGSTTPAMDQPGCSNKMDACYVNCKREGAVPDICNRTCTTDWICAAPLRMTYGQYLDFQIEMLASNTKK